MSFDADFLELMPYTVGLTAPTGRNNNGNPTYVGGVTRPYRCRIVGDLLSLRNTKNSVQSPAFVMYVNCGEDVIESDYQITLPNIPSLGSDVPFIFAVERIPDETGQHHVKLICGFTFHHQTAL